MDDKYYKVVADNLGEYSVLTKDNELIITEIQNKATAELFCDKLNELHEEILMKNQQIKSCTKKNRQMETALDKLGYKYVGDLND